jgi:hypothetical protein
MNRLLFAALLIALASLGLTYVGCAQQSNSPPAESPSGTVAGEGGTSAEPAAPQRGGGW